ncbi:MAG: hypothetical protein KAU50_01830, partial [Candidatus Marinimicrobia bacterium]|nr:hypothetical protein [Candidatus Neomarinimicrobiota bacterium]
MTYRLRRARIRGNSFPNYLRLGVYAVILILTPLDAQTSRDGSLYSLVVDIKGAMPTSGSNRYVEPTAERITVSPVSRLPGGCTIGVASGTATSDGRPMVWKTRDYIDKPNNEVDYNTSYKYKFIAVINAGESYVRMGVNEKGFAIVNSSAYDLPEGSTGPGNGLTMRHALGICATVAEFTHFLDSTNVTGRTTQGNLAVLDSTGAAALFEVGGNVYWKYDAADTAVAPHGYVLRTNFAVNGDGSGSGLERYARQQTLIGEYHAGDSLNYRSIIRHQMRDFSDLDGNPVPVPYPGQWLPERPFGYIYTGVSICRYKSVSAAVIQGVLLGEFAGLSTMWTMLGQPASSITVPYWPVGNTPEEAIGNPTAPLCDVANQIKALLFDYATNSYYIDSYKLRDGSGGGLWTQTFPVEDSIFSAAETLLVQWRTDTLLVNEMLAAETAYAEYAL